MKSEEFASTLIPSVNGPECPKRFSLFRKVVPQAKPIQPVSECNPQELKSQQISKSFNYDGTQVDIVEARLGTMIFVELPCIEISSIRIVQEEKGVLITGRKRFRLSKEGIFCCMDFLENSMNECSLRIPITHAMNGDISHSMVDGVLRICVERSPNC